MRAARGYLPAVSQKNMEVARRTLESFNSGGVEAALPFFDPEVEWIAPPEWLERHVYEGHAGIREIASAWSQNFDAYRLEAQEYIEAGDDVVVLIYQRGRIKGSSDPIEQPIGYVWSVRDGKTVRVRVHFSWEEALRDAGIEDARD